MSSSAAGTRDYDRFPASSNGSWFYEDKLRNTVRHDLLLDYLSVHGDRLGFEKDPDHYRKSGAIYDARMEFSNFISNNRRPFIKKIIEKWMDILNQLFGSEGIIPRPQSNLFDPSTIPDHVKKQRIVCIGESEMSPFDPELSNETRAAMMSGFPIIVGGVMMLEDKHWMCRPDFLIRSDILPLLFQKVSCKVADSSMIGAPNIGLVQCHYVVVQSRFISLHFTSSDGINNFTLKNMGNILLYKTMAYYQSVILEQIQGFRPMYAFIMGRSCEWQKSDFNSLDENDEEIADEDDEDDAQESKEQGQEEKQQDKEQLSNNNHALYTLGHVNCREWEDQTVISKENGEPIERCMLRVISHIDQALHWWNWLYTPAAYQVVMTSDTRLYPNMKNMESFPWQFVKKKLAKENGEITQLWLAGYKFRDNCFRRGVMNLQDVRMKDMIGQLMKKESKRTQVILKIWQQQQQTQEEEDEKQNKVSPLRMQCRLYDWNIPRKVEWYIDFETTESLFDDFSTFPSKSQQSFIAMIGSLMVDPTNGNMRYRCFVVNELSMLEEKRILEEWFQDCREMGASLGAPNIEDPATTSFIHWSQAECKFLETNRLSAKNRHKPHSDSWPKLPFLDMLEVVKSEPVCIQGCYSFKLKAFAKSLYKLGHINVDWPSGSQCDSGLNAMTALFLCNQDAKQQNIPITDIPLMKEIIEYNRIDCLSMFQIVQYLRNYHC